MNGLKNGTVNWRNVVCPVIPCEVPPCSLIIHISLLTDTSRNEVDKLQQHLALLKEEYVKLQTVHHELERKYALLSATSGEISENSYVLRLVKIVNGLFDNHAFRYHFNSLFELTDWLVDASLLSDYFITSLSIHSSVSRIRSWNWFIKTTPWFGRNSNKLNRLSLKF